MNPRTRNRAGLVLIALLFAAPIVTAYVLNAAGWRPHGMRNYGTLIEPAQDLTGASFMLDDGQPIRWKDAEWSWTLIALTGPDCAEHCLARIDELRRARLTLNQNAYRLRVVVLDPPLAADQLEALKPIEHARDVDGRLAAFRPKNPDEVSAVLIDPHGFLILSYPVDYDANRLRKDLARLIKA